MQLVCLKCERRLAVHVELPEDGCPHCGAKEWAHVDVPAKAYALSEHDRRFLRSLRIAP